MKPGTIIDKIEYKAKDGKIRIYENVKVIESTEKWVSVRTSEGIKKLIKSEIK